jgi:hypothetical protein
MKLEILQTKSGWMVSTHRIIVNTNVMSEFHPPMTQCFDDPMALLKCVAGHIGSPELLTPKRDSKGHFTHKP